MDRTADECAKISGEFVCKEKLRREMKNALSLLPKDQFQEAGLRAVSLISSSYLWDKYKTILLFLSMKTEIDTLPLLETALKDGKSVFLPRMEGEKIRFYRFQSQDSLKKGPYGLLEPLPKGPLLASDFPALIFSPGLAFDRQGNRLGRGGGFYDRFFAELEGTRIEDSGIKEPQYLALGLCMEVQIVPSIPVDKWDRKLSGLCTELEKICTLHYLKQKRKNGTNKKRSGNCPGKD